MENKVKGTRYDDRNGRRYCQYCSNSYQHNCYSHQYLAVLQTNET